ncbi:MAG TPA: sigma-70 family RNA polymerase sigma factor [Opitutaceae bacterium]
MDERPSDPLPTRLSLLARLKNLDDSESWSEFFNTYKRLVLGLARRRGLTEHEAEDVAQEVFLRLSQTIKNFERGSRPGSFRSWLGQLTRWRSDDKCRKLTRVPTPVAGINADDGTDIIDRVPARDDSEDAFEAEARAHLLEVLFKRLQASVPPRDLQVFQLVALEGMEPDAVARLFHLTRTHVYVIKHRIVKKLREEAQRIPLDLETM